MLILNKCIIFYTDTEACRGNFMDRKCSFRLKSKAVNEHGVISAYAVNVLGVISAYAINVLGVISAYAVNVYGVISAFSNFITKRFTNHALQHEQK